jgi:hypothetical protein
LIVAIALLVFVSNTAIAAGGNRTPLLGASITADTPTAHNTPGVNNIPGGMMGPTRAKLRPDTTHLA